MPRKPSEPMLSPFGANLSRLRKERRMSQSELADLLGVTRNTIGNWECGRAFPQLDAIRAISAIFSVSQDSLFDAAGGGKIAPSPATSDVQVFGSIAAGTPLDMEEGDYTFPAPSELIRRHPNAFYLEVDGESMSRVLPNGCMVLVDPDDREPVISGRVYAVAVNGYTATVKRIRSLENGFELIPDSNDPTFRPRVYDYGEEGTETITIIGRVVWYSVPFDYEI